MTTQWYTQAGADAAIAVETSRATAAEGTNASAITAEATARAAAITALAGTFVSKTPTVGSYTYTAGLVTGDPDGITYTYNGDGTLHTETIPQPGGGTITRTYSYNSDGTIASVA